MLKVVDIVYHCHTEYSDPQDVLDKHLPTIGFTAYIKDRVDYTIVRHLDYEGSKITNGIRFAFFKRRNAPWQIPYKSHRFIKSIDPDIVLVHGLIFPLQVIVLKRMLGKKCAVILQQHADYPVHSIRKIFQKMADAYIDAYMFTSAAIAEPWLNHKVIRDRHKIKALSGASAAVKKMDKTSCRESLGLSGHSNFLWVGRLNENKDPVTILKAFALHAKTNPLAMLYMAYHTEELLVTVKKMIYENRVLQCHVQLLGKLSAQELAIWYNAADFFISGSHAEAAGYALLEAMSVGCIPVVTRIPSFQQILGDGPNHFLFAAGDTEGLVAVLGQCANTAVCNLSQQTEQYFARHLSFKTVADGMYKLFLALHAEKL